MQLRSVIPSIGHTQWLSLGNRGTLHDFFRWLELIDAKDVYYDNKSSGLPALNVQLAIDYLAKGGISSGGGDASVYNYDFEVSEWEKVLSNYEFTITAFVHQRGLKASVIEILRAGGSYSEGVSVSTRRYTNGNIALVSNQPFDGAVSII